MAARKQTMSFRADEDLKERVQAYQERRDHDQKSEALEELARIGLREAQSPMLYRAKDRAVEGAWHMALLAVVVTVAGVATAVLSAPHAIMVAAVLLAVGASLIASVELLRFLNGQGSLATLQEVVRG